MKQDWLASRKIISEPTGGDGYKYFFVSFLGRFVEVQISNGIKRKNSIYPEDLVN